MWKYKDSQVTVQNNVSDYKLYHFLWSSIPNQQLLTLVQITPTLFNLFSSIAKINLPYNYGLLLCVHVLLPCWACLEKNSTFIDRPNSKLQTILSQELDYPGESNC